MEHQLKIAYLTLQTTSEGQAAHAHVHEIVKGLRQRGVDVNVFEPDYHDKKPGLLRRAVEFLRVQLRLAVHIFEFDIIYVREHFGALFIALLSSVIGRPTVQEVNGPYSDIVSCYPSMAPFAKLLEWATRWQFRAMPCNILTTTHFR